MRLGFDLTLEQAQKLIMTPELRQAIQILQFTSQELTQYIETQMESNPLLEVEVQQSKEDDIQREDGQEDIDWKEYLDKYDDISYSNSKNYNEQDNRGDSFEDYTAMGTTLKDHLLFQLNLIVFDKRMMEIGQFIIESIDNKGYLNSTVKDIALQLNVSMDEVEKVLKIIQTFDPIGVAARDPKECLLIQLKQKKVNDEDVYTIIKDYLQDVAQNRLTKISKDLNITLKKVQWTFDLIKSLEPKPGRGFAHHNDEIKFVTPDITLQNINGEYVVLVNDVTAPRLVLNSFYKKLLRASKDQNISDYLTKKLNSAMWIIKSIEQRRMTLYKVVKSILKFQKDFFIMGEKSLKPLTLKDVAEDIDVHESTVSRATNGKYIQTPMGIFELKYFFSNGVASHNGGIASTSIKSMIKELINKENSKKPLSDQKIANNLKERGINISRRTVAKYRDELNIPSSSKRRRF